MCEFQIWNNKRSYSWRKEIKVLLIGESTGESTAEQMGL
jgi:hypothetical protein